MVCGIFRIVREVVLSLRELKFVLSTVMKNSLIKGKR